MNKTALKRLKRLTHFALLLPLIAVTWPVEYHETGEPLIWSLREAWDHVRWEHR